MDKQQGSGTATLVDVASSKQATAPLPISRDQSPLRTAAGLLRKTLLDGYICCLHQAFLSACKYRPIDCGLVDRSQI